MKKRFKSVLLWLASGSWTNQQMRLAAFEGFPRPFETFCARLSKDWIKGVEIGVFEGSHAASILRVLKPGKLYLVDPYLAFDEKQMTGAHVEAALRKAQKRLTGKQVEFLRCKSTEANLNHVDFIYLDADHRYEAVKADIEYWWPRLNRKGVMGGHDFSSGQSEVVQAVTEWAVANKLKLHCETPDWWVVKSENY